MTGNTIKTFDTNLNSEFNLLDQIKEIENMKLFKKNSRLYKLDSKMVFNSDLNLVGGESIEKFDKKTQEKAILRQATVLEKLDKNHSKFGYRNKNKLLA